MADQEAKPAHTVANNAASRLPAPDPDLTKGLSAGEANKRLAQYGPNAIEEKKTTLLQRLIRYFWGPIPWMI